MKTRGLLLVGVGLLAVLGTCLALRSGDTEPRYRGRRLSRWVDGLSTPFQSRAGRLESEVAIEQIGPAALPFLMTWLAESPQPAKVTIQMKLRNWLPFVLRRSRLWLWVERKQAEAELNRQFRAANAEFALQLLGENARPAVPELMNMLNNTGQSSTAFRAGNVLGGLGPVVLPELLRAISNPQFSNHFGLVGLIGRMHRLGDEATPLVTFLCRNVEQPSSSLRQACVEALGNLAVAPEQAVPALFRTFKESLDGDDVILSRKSAEALGQFGPRSDVAVPTLCAALKSPDGITTEEAARALGRIHTQSDLAVPALVEYLRTGGARHRRFAIEGLAPYGAAAREALPLLRDALQDEDHDTRALAREVLGKIESDSAKPPRESK